MFCKYITCGQGGPVELKSVIRLAQIRHRTIKAAITAAFIKFTSCPGLDS